MRSALLLPLLLLSACSVADNLSYADLTIEFDGIAVMDSAGERPSVRYQERAPVSYWYARQLWLWPLHLPLEWLMGVRGEDDLPHPQQHARELLAELPDEAGSGLAKNAQVALRAGWVAAFDANVASRLLGLDVLVQTAERLALPLLGNDPSAFASSAGVPACQAQWLAVQQAAQVAPSREQDAALRQALVLAMRATLVTIIQQRDPLLTELRLCAMAHCRRLGGLAVVPWLVALTTAAPAAVRAGESRFEPDPFVRLRLVSYCGQLRGELARQELKLQGAQNWEALSPLDFLAQTYLGELTYYSPLRVAALAGLSLALERAQLAENGDWVRPWLDQGKQFPAGGTQP